MRTLWGLHRVTVSIIWGAIAMLVIGLMTSCGGGGGTAVGGQPPTDQQPPTNGQPPTQAYLRWIARPEDPESVAPRPFGMSADGQVVVGAVGPGGSERAFRWTPQGGLQLLENIGDGSEAMGVSPDGSVVVGWASEVEGMVRPKPVWWDAQGKVHVLAESGEAWAAASQGGQVIAGFLGSNNDVAAVWKNGQLRSLEVPGRAFAVSTDGTKVFGYSEGELFVWSEDLGVRYLGLAGDDTARFSGDGSVIVVALNTGWSVWKSTGQLIPLQLPSGYTWLYVYDISADGTTIVGWIDAQNRSEAARWTADGTVQNLNQVFSDLLTDGSRLERAMQVSADGRYIAGEGYNAATRRREMFWLYTGGR